MPLISTKFSSICTILIYLLLLIVIMYIFEQLLVLNKNENSF